MYWSRFFKWQRRRYSQPEKVMCTCLKTEKKAHRKWSTNRPHLDIVKSTIAHWYYLPATREKSYNFLIFSRRDWYYFIGLFPELCSITLNVHDSGGFPVNVIFVPGNDTCSYSNSCHIRTLIYQWAKSCAQTSHNNVYVETVSDFCFIVCKVCMSSLSTQTESYVSTR